jgi:6,7-dimethyl-8-ribityllumazine synthase
MSGHLTSLTALSESEIQFANSYHFAIIVTDWHKQITEKLKDGVLGILAHCNVPIEHIITLQVPGSFELPLAAKWAIETMKADAVICLGCIIKGDTKHDEYIALAVSQGIMNLNTALGKPVIFGVLTVEKMQQALDRAGGIHGNKGEEAAVTAIKMLHLNRQLNS